MGSEEDESFIDQMFGLSTPVNKCTHEFEIQTPVSLRSQGPQATLTRPKSLKSETSELPVVSAPPSTPSPKRKRPRTQQKKRQRSARDSRPNSPLDYTANPKLQSTILPPGSFKITRPAQTSHSQHPPSQYASINPLATAHKFKAAEPYARNPCAMPPDSEARFLNVKSLTSKAFA